jgi:hypothetical protein
MVWNSNDYRAIEVYDDHRHRYHTVLIPLTEPTRAEELHMAKKESSTHDVIITHETGKAYQLAFPNSEGEVHWIPKSCIVQLSIPDSEGNAIATIHDWITKQKGVL